MGMPGGVTEEIRKAADEVAAAMLPALAEARRAENVAAAAAVHSIHELTEMRLASENDVHDSGGEADIQYARRAVECEAAVALSLSKTVTRDMMKVGAQLVWRLPTIDAAFTAGDLDYPRARAIALTLDKASDETASALEADVLAAALRTNTRSLKERIWKAWYLYDAEEAAEAQKKAASEERCADIRRGEDGTATLIAKMTTLEGAECDAVLEELTGTVCPRDPRTKKQLRGFALLALVHREEYIACRCGRDECPVRGVADRFRDRRTPLIKVMIDVETLLGLTNEPATLSDGTVLDPEIARHIAGNAQWQMFLTETLEALDSYTADDNNGGGDDDDDAGGGGGGGAGGGGDGGGGDGGGGAGSGGGDSSDRGPSSASDESASSATASTIRVGPAGRPRARRLIHRGKVRTGAVVPTARPAARNSAGTAARTGDETMLSQAISDFLDAVAVDPKLAEGIHPDGHGGFIDPPPGALTYRPSAELVALTRATHCTCTFPNCAVPAARCEIDHIVPFMHADPHSGGWTILSNLQPLCKFHHQAKTMKLWAAAKLHGDSIYWVSTSGLHHITPSTFGTVMVPDTFIHNTPNRRNLAPPRGSGTYFTDLDTADIHSDATVVLECPLSDAVYEPTWWEIHICDTDSTWTKVANLRSPVAEGTLRIPSLGDIARIADAQDLADAVFIRQKFLEHRAVIAAREQRNYRAPF